MAVIYRVCPHKTLPFEKPVLRDIIVAAVRARGGSPLEPSVRPALAPGDLPGMPATQLLAPALAEDRVVSEDNAATNFNSLPPHNRGRVLQMRWTRELC